MTMSGVKRFAMIVPLLMVALAGPAFAESVVTADPVGDAESWRFDPDPGSCEPPTVEPTGTNDIRRLIVRHSADRVVIALRVARLGPLRDTHVEFRVRTPRRAWDVSMVRWDGRYHVELTPPPPPPDLEPGECHYGYATSPRSCRGSAGGIDRAAGIVRVSLTRTCLGTPRWVRVRADVSSWVDDVLLSDDVPRLGPRVYSGTR